MIEFALLEIESLDGRLLARTRHPDRPAGFDDEGALADGCPYSAGPQVRQSRAARCNGHSPVGAAPLAGRALAGRH